MDDVESFIPDRSLYELGDQDLKELWDTENFEMSLAESSNNNDTEYVWYDTEEEFRSVILNDRMMTDAALPGGAPIKHEHSYSLAGRNNKRSYSPDPQSTRYDDMDIECYPVISMRPAGEGLGCKRKRVIVKTEPVDPDSNPVQSDKTTRIPFKQSPGTQSLLKHKTLLITPSMSAPSKSAPQKINIKVEPDSSSYSLPPTPPSSYNSDSEGSLSPLHSSADSRSLRGVPVSSCQVTANSNRHPISTPLISSQPKGASGMLILTEEEKRTLIAEGYPVPTKLPLTKAEERSLKKIRRKIKNKISAQESRRKKKEYMDLLERKVEFLASENFEYRKQVNTLESLNNNLQNELERLRYKLEFSSKADTKGTQTVKIETPDYSMFPENIVSVNM